MEAPSKAVSVKCPWCGQKQVFHIHKWMVDKGNTEAAATCGSCSGGMVVTLAATNPSFDRGDRVARQKQDEPPRGERRPPPSITANQGLSPFQQQQNDPPVTQPMQPQVPPSGPFGPQQAPQPRRQLRPPRPMQGQPQGQPGQRPRRKGLLDYFKK